MKGFLGKYWWVFLLRGIAAVIFGILAFVSPGITLATLVLVWGAYALADGIFSPLIAAISGKTADEDRWMVGLQGAIGVIAELIALVLPGATALGLLFAIAAWSLAIGVLQIVAIDWVTEITERFLGLGACCRSSSPSS